MAGPARSAPGVMLAHPGVKGGEWNVPGALIQYDGRGPAPVIMNAQARIPANCPNCGAPVRWRQCDYCRSSTVAA